MAAATTQRRPSGAAGPRRLAAGIAVLGVLVLPGCSENQRAEDALAVGLGNPELRHPVDFAQRTELLDVEVPEGTEGLSPNQEVDVFRFLGRYRRQSVGRLTITVPAGSRDPASIEHALKGIQRGVTEAGVDYRVKRGPRPPKADVPVIRLAYRRPVAIPPTCNHWEENVGRNEDREPYPNFGCATQRNTAVMIDNARDLIRPQPTDPRASERRSVTWSEYIGTPKSGGGGGDAGGGDAKKAPAPKK